MIFSMFYYEECWVDNDIIRFDDNNSITFQGVLLRFDGMIHYETRVYATSTWIEMDVVYHVVIHNELTRIEDKTF